MPISSVKVISNPSAEPYDVNSSSPKSKEIEEKSTKTKRIVSISDTHNKHENIKDLPFGDIIIHAGDFSNYGNDEEVEGFFKWFSKLPHKYKILICGNHERKLSELDRSSIQEKFKNCIYLENTGVEVEGIKFYGSPHTSIGMAYNAQPTEEGIGRFWKKIPSDVDILITHSPPHGILDKGFGLPDGTFPDTAGHEKPPPPPEEWNVPKEVVHGAGRNALMDAIRSKSRKKRIEEEKKECEVCLKVHPKYTHWGCKLLKEKILEIKPAVHIFGHVHEENGTYKENDTLFINAATCKSFGGKPVVFDVCIK